MYIFYQPTFINVRGKKYKNKQANKNNKTQRFGIVLL